MNSRSNMVLAECRVSNGRRATKLSPAEYEIVIALYARQALVRLAAVHSLLGVQSVAVGSQLGAVGATLNLVAVTGDAAHLTAAHLGWAGRQFHDRGLLSAEPWSVL